MNSTNRGKKQGGQAGAGGQTSGGTVAVGDVGSNALRALDCQRCRLASKLTVCPGCKKIFILGRGHLPPKNLNTRREFNGFKLLWKISHPL